jgi:adenosylcobyric acid synthase
VLLVGDIDKGGVFASLVGTLALLDEDERDYIKGFIINKFRGDVSLLEPGLKELERTTSVPTVGVVSYYHDIFIDEEDSVRREAPDKALLDLDLAIIHLPHISNSTDFEPLQREGGVGVRYVRRVEELGHPDAIVVPGSKSTVSDLARIREVGLAEGILQRSRSGTPVIGICGGFQMLGKRIEDPQHAESEEDAVPGLGLLDVVTTFESGKTTWQVRAQHIAQHGPFAELANDEITGYEIHMGQTLGARVTPAFRILQRGDQQTDHVDGAVDETGTVLGTYLHGLFENTPLRHAFLSVLRDRKGIEAGPQGVLSGKEEQYDKLADHVRASLNMGLVRQICGL